MLAHDQKNGDRTNPERGQWQNWGAQTEQAKDQAVIVGDLKNRREAGGAPLDSQGKHGL
jgi:hypothetical protein